MNAESYLYLGEVEARSAPRAASWEGHKRRRLTALRRGVRQWQPATHQL